MNKNRRLLFLSMPLATLLFLSCVSNGAAKTAGAGSSTGSGDVAVRQLSDYCPSLRDTPGDTAVFVLDSLKPGASLLLVAGTHGNEVAGVRAAGLFTELAHVERGRVFVIPALNRAGVLAGQRLVPLDYRDINRSYPGAENGGLAQKIAFAVMQLIVSENIDIAIDLHEASPTSDLAWSIVSNPKNVHIAALAALDLEEDNMPMLLEVSPPDMDGLSHKEWGNRTGAMSFLVETANPAQASNPSSEEVNDPRHALDWRVRVHLEAVRHIVARCNEELPLPLLYSWRGVVDSENSQ